MLFVCPGLFVGEATDDSGHEFYIRDLLPRSHNTQYLAML